MEARAPRNAAYRGEPVGSTAAALAWIASFAIPGLGMFTEAYFIFSVRARLWSCCMNVSTGVVAQ